ncbi:hypothetical protein JY456_03805 [Stenotrophomonas maltophilia]|nr:hypothetical protein [Stenotrophomonas maltophilia]
MAWLDGVFRCSPLGIDDCVVWWDAVGALGTWIAAAVTFLAVLLPYRASRKKEAVSSKVALVDFDLALKDLKRRLSAAEILIEVRDGSSSWLSAADLDSMRLPPIAHGIQPSKNAENLLVSISLLRVAIADWNATIDPYTRIQAPDPADLRSAFDHLGGKHSDVLSRYARVSEEFGRIY